MGDPVRLSAEEAMQGELNKGKHGETEGGTAVADRNGLLIYGTGTLKEASQDILKYNDIGAAATCAELINLVNQLDTGGRSKPEAIILEGDHDKITIKAKGEVVSITHSQQS